MWTWSSRSAAAARVARRMVVFASWLLASLVAAGTGAMLVKAALAHELFPVPFPAAAGVAPSLYEATYEVRQLSMERSSLHASERVVKPASQSVLFSMCFRGSVADLRLDGTQFPVKWPWHVQDTALQGLSRLSCGRHHFESFPSSSSSPSSSSRAPRVVSFVDEHASLCSADARSGRFQLSFLVDIDRDLVPAGLQSAESWANCSVSFLVNKHDRGTDAVAHLTFADGTELPQHVVFQRRNAWDSAQWTPKFSAQFHDLLHELHFVGGWQTAKATATAPEHGENGSRDAYQDHDRADDSIEWASSSFLELGKSTGGYDSSSTPLDTHSESFVSHWYKAHPPEKRERLDTPAEAIAMLELSQRLSMTSGNRLRGKMIYELVIRPLITICKKMIILAGQKIGAVTLVTLLEPLISGVIIAYTGSKLVVPDPDTEGQGLPDAEEDWGRKTTVFMEEQEEAVERGHAVAHEPIQLEAESMVHTQAQATVETETSVFARTYASEKDLSEMDALLKVATKHSHQARIFTDTLVGLIEPKLLDQIAQGVTAQVQLQLQKALADVLSSDMRQRVNNTVARKVTQALVARLTERLSNSVVEICAHILSKDLTELTTKDVTKVLIPELTYSLTHTISLAFTRHPIYDYFCHFCETHDLYCADCKSALLDDYYRGFYNTYYAHYFEKYFTYYYGDYFAKLFCNKASPTFWSGNEERRPEPISHCLDPSADDCIDARNTPQQDGLTKQ